MHCNWWAAALVAICGLWLGGCEDAEDRAPARAGGKATPVQSVHRTTSADHDSPGRLHVAEQGFSFVPPAGWSALANVPPSFVTYGMPPENGFAINMNVNAMPDQGMPIDRAPAELKAGLPRVFNAWRCAEDGFVDVNGRARLPNL